MKEKGEPLHIKDRSCGKYIINKTPLRLLVVTAGVLFLAEALIMMFLSVLPPMGKWTVASFDALMNVVLVLPMLYLLIFRTLHRSIKHCEESEKTLRESEERMQLALQGADLGTWDWNIKTDKVTFNRRWAEMLGLSLEEIAPHLNTWKKTVHPDDMPNIMKVLNEHLEGKTDTYESEHRLKHSSGHWIWVLDKGRIIEFDKDGKPIRACGTLLDITKRKLTEEALRESEEKYKKIIESSHDAIMLTGPDGVISYISPACKRVLGYDAKDLVGNQPWIVHPDDHEKVKSIFYRALQGEDGSNFEYRINTKTNETKWVSHSWSPTLDNGKLRLVVSVLSDITKRKLAEEALRESEEKYRLIFETAANLINSVDSNGTIVDCNNKIEEVLGYKREEIVGQSMKKIIHPDYHPEVLESLKQLITNGVKHDQEYKMVRKDGKLIDVKINSSSITDKQGNFVRSICIIDDVTERRKADKALRESEEKFRTLFEQSADAILIIEGDQFVDCNLATVKMLGYSNKKELLETHPSQLSPEKQPDGRDSFEKANEMMSLTYDQGSHRFEWDHKRRNGEVFPVEVLLTAVPFGERKFLHVVWRDITERKQTEEANARLSRAIEHADETIVVTDAEGTIQYVNPSFERITGYTVKGSIGQNPRILKSGKQDDDFYKNMWETLANGNEWHGEIINKKKDGTLFTENATISPVFDSNGKIINYVAVKSDITETKRLQELESRAARLELAGTIAGQVAHDFNNLLAPIMAYPEFIHEELPRSSKAHTFLDTIEEAAKKIAHINQDLLTMGRRGHYNQEVLDLNRIILHATKEMESRTKTVTVETSLCEDLMKIKGGGAQLHRVISNLLVNAQDAVQNIGKVIVKSENYYVDEMSVTRGCVPRGEYVKLTVSDDGYGIPDGVIAKIFDPFFTTKTTDKKRGSGLGLSVVDAVVKDHNGYLDLTSEVGRGTSFYLYFPATRENAGEDESLHLSGGSETILIVDDDNIQREVTSQLLTKLGYKVSSVESGENAVELLRENPYELVILDMVMPGGIDGSEAYRQILEVRPQQKAIIMSGFSESSRVIEAQKLGAGAFVRKPVTKSVIAAAVRVELDRQVEVDV